MNLTKLFETQKILDQRIIKQHGLEGQDLLPQKILALQVELGECANEWRGFKFWSKDRNPRYERKCHACRGEGNFKGEKLGRRNGKNIYIAEPCLYCESTGIEARPLLEEYADCLHFILSIGSELQFVSLEIVEPFTADTGLAQQFNVLFKHVGGLKFQLEADWDSGRKKYLHILRLFAGLGELLGFTWNQIEQAYYSKNEINHTRQDTGY